MQPTDALVLQREQLEIMMRRTTQMYLEAVCDISLGPPLYAKRRALKFPQSDMKFHKYMQPEVHSRTQTHQRHICDTLRWAETYFVDEHMMPLITSLAETLPADTPQPWSPPSPYGFVTFPVPVLFTESPGQVRGFLWATRRDTTTIYTLSPSFNPKWGTLALSRIETIIHGLPIRTLRYGAFADAMLTTSSEHEVAAQRRMTLLAFWYLCHETIHSHGTVRIPTTRAAEREFTSVAGKLRPAMGVRVIRLRHVSTAKPSEPRDWSHRWTVRGHWRQQRCGPGRTMIKRVWIAPHVKGPEGKPLSSSEKVHYLVR